MPELKRDLICADNDTHLTFLYGHDAYVIDANHTIGDVLRHLLSECADKDHFKEECDRIYYEA